MKSPKIRFWCHHCQRNLPFVSKENFVKHLRRFHWDCPYCEKEHPEILEGSNRSVTYALKAVSGSRNPSGKQITPNRLLTRPAKPDGKLFTEPVMSEMSEMCLKGMKGLFGPGRPCEHCGSSKFTRKWFGTMWLCRSCRVWLKTLETEGKFDSEHDI